MPEVPDLEAIRGFLTPRLANNPVTAVEARQPWLVRTGAAHLNTLAGHGFVDVRRLGKFLLLTTDDGRVLVVNPMLTGRFHWALSEDRRTSAPAIVLAFADGHELRYADERRMGRFYLVPIDDLDTVPQIAELGPDALAIDEDAFAQRLGRRRGQLKNTLTNQQFIAGIGNAYSDEILWEAGFHPHRRGATLDDDGRRRRALPGHAARPRLGCRSSRHTSSTASSSVQRNGGTICASTARPASPARAAARRSGAAAPADAKRTSASAASRSTSSASRS